MGVVYFFLFVLIAGGAGVGYLLVNPPSDLIRQRIAEEVKARTGRDLVIAGRASFKFFPVFAISLKDVSLSGPPGMEGALLHTHALEVSVKAMTLLSRQPEIDSVTLKKPLFDFRIDKDGQKNWKFAARQAPTRLAELQTRGSLRDAGSIEIAAAEADPDSPRTGDAGNVKLNNVTLEDGTFRFTDERTGKTSEVSAVNVKLGLPSLETPLVANGNLVWHDQRLDFDGKLEDVRSLFTEKPAHLSFNTKNAVITASYDGGMVIKDGAYLEGQVTALSDSTRGLAEWFGTKLPPVTGFGPMSIQGTLKTGGNVTTFSNAEFELDGAAAKGTIKVTTGGVRPFVEANLAISELDLNKYLTSAVTGTLAKEGGAGTGNEPPDAAPAAAAAPAAPSEPDQIQKLLQDQQGSKVYGMEQRAGWSSEQLNLTLLGVADGNARVNVSKLRFKNISIGQSSVDVALKDHAMQAKFNDVALYQGHGNGVLTVDGSSGSANVGAKFDLDGISALPFLEDAANFGWVSGNAKVELQLMAIGAKSVTAHREPQRHRRLPVCRRCRRRLQSTGRHTWSIEWQLCCSPDRSFRENGLQRARRDLHDYERRRSESGSAARQPDAESDRRRHRSHARADGRLHGEAEARRLARRSARRCRSVWNRSAGAHYRLLGSAVVSAGSQRCAVGSEQGCRDDQGDRQKAQRQERRPDRRSAVRQKRRRRRDRFDVEHKEEREGSAEQVFRQRWRVISGGPKGGGREELSSRDALLLRSISAVVVSFTGRPRAVRRPGA